MLTVLPPSTIQRRPIGAESQSEIDGGLAHPCDVAPPAAGDVGAILARHGLRRRGLAT